MKIFNITKEEIKYCHVVGYFNFPDIGNGRILKDYSSNNEFIVLETGYHPSNHSLTANNVERTSELLHVVYVKFPTTPKTYEYFVRTTDNINIGDTVKIAALSGDAEVKIISKVSVSATTKATKMLPIIREPKRKFYNLEVKFIDDKEGLSRPYYYSCEDIKLPTQLYDNKVKYVTLVENNEIVCARLETTTYVPRYGLKTFRSIKSEDADLIHKKLLKHRTADIEMAYNALKNRGFYEHSYDKEVFLKTIEKLIKNRQLGQKITEEYNKEKENKTMNMNKIFGNMEFGKMNTNAIKYSVAGLAFRSVDGSYLTYDLDKMEATNVADMVFDMDCVFAMPIAAKDVKRGDIVKHQGIFVIIKDKYEDGTIAAIDPVNSTEITIIPVKNVFGFNYVTKVFNMFEGMAPNGDNPFGDMSKMLPMMMFMGEKGNNDMFSMFAMMSMCGGDCKDMMSNPLMMYAMMKGDM